MPVDDALQPAATRVAGFASYLRDRGYDVRSDEEAILWLARGVQATRDGERWFDTSSHPLLNRVHGDALGGAVLDDAARREANGDPVDPLSADHVHVVADIVRGRQTVLDRPAGTVFDSADGRAIAELNPWSGDFAGYAAGLDDRRVGDAVGTDANGSTFGERLGYALALQHAVDGRAEIAAYAAGDEYLDTRLPHPDADDVVVEDRIGLEDRRERGGLPTAHEYADTRRVARMGLEPGEAERKEIAGRIDRAEDGSRLAGLGTDRRPDPAWANAALTEMRAVPQGEPKLGDRVRNLTGRRRARAAEAAALRPPTELERRLADAARAAVRGPFPHSREATSLAARDGLTDRPARTAEERFEEFAGNLRRRNFDVRGPADALTYLDDGIAWAAQGQRWFDTAMPKMRFHAARRDYHKNSRDPLYSTGLVGERIADGLRRSSVGAGNVDINRAMLRMVAEISATRLHLDGGIPGRLSDTADGRAIGRLRLGSPDTAEYLVRLYESHPRARETLDRYARIPGTFTAEDARRVANRTHDALSFQYAADGRVLLSSGFHRVAQLDERGTSVAPSVVEDRAELGRWHVERAANAEFLGVRTPGHEARLTELDKVHGSSDHGRRPWFSWEDTYRDRDARNRAIELNRTLDAVARRTGGDRLDPELTRPGENLNYTRYVTRDQLELGEARARTRPARPRAVEPAEPVGGASGTGARTAQARQAGAPRRTPGRDRREPHGDAPARDGNTKVLGER